MNWLLEGLPGSVTVDGAEFNVNVGFRAFFLVDQIMRDDVLTDYDRVDQALDIFYNGNVPKNREAAMGAFLRFQRGNEPERKAGKSRKKRRALDYAKDCGLIYSAFLQTYRIDLTKDNIHWWTFLALLQSLPEDCQLCKVMYYRTADLAGVSKSYRRHIVKMRAMYELKDDAEIDDRVRLAERNRKWMKYVEARVKEGEHGG